jgi:hypothetical protein
MTDRFGSDDDVPRSLPSDVWDGSAGHTARVPAVAPRPLQRTRTSGDVEPPNSAPRRGRADATGSVAALRQRIESHRRLPTSQIVNFRLERYDSRGNRLQPIPVEMRGITISGHVADGERVHVTGRFHEGTLYAKKVDNLTTGGGLSTGTSSRFGRFMGRRNEIAIVVAVLVILGLCVRFIPAVSYNTPFGLHEYRSDVLGTCTRLQQISATSPNVTFNLDGTLPLPSILATLDSNRAAAQETFTRLYSHVTPIVSRSRLSHVKAAEVGLLKYLADLRGGLSKLPMRVSQGQLQRVQNQFSTEGATATSRMDDALTQLAGADCHVE